MTKSERFDRFGMFVEPHKGHMPLCNCVATSFCSTYIVRVTPIVKENKYARKASVDAILSEHWFIQSKTFPSKSRFEAISQSPPVSGA